MNLIKCFGAVGIICSIMYAFLSMPSEFRKGAVPELQDEIFNIKKLLEDDHKQVLLMTNTMHDLSNQLTTLRNDYKNFSAEVMPSCLIGDSTRVFIHKKH